jgi:hypothetical protein
MVLYKALSLWRSLIPKPLRLGAQGVDYLMRSANVKDLDGDGFAEIAVTITTIPATSPANYDSRGKG